MTSIAHNLELLHQTIPGHVKLIAVSKTKPVSDLEAAYNAGQRAFGENYVMEMVEKQQVLPHDIEWHFIGHLQSNKVKNIAPFVSYIHAVHSIKLLEEIQKQASKFERRIHVLLQFHIADEDTKHGFDTADYNSIFEQVDWESFPNVIVSGVMGMASFVTNQRQIEKEFEKLHAIFTDLKQNYFSHSEEFKEISMGMSGDWPLAVEKGSTMVRIGSAIFGNR